MSYQEAWVEFARKNWQRAEDRSIDLYLQQKADHVALGHLLNLVADLMKLEPLKAATSPASSAPTTGLATKPYASYTAGPSDALMGSLPAILQYMPKEIGDSFKSMLSTRPALTVSWPDSSTLQLTFLWPTNSGSNEAGNPGHVGHEY